MKQNYRNHVKYFIPHHFVFLPLMTLLVIIGFRNYFVDGNHELAWAVGGVLSLCILFLAIMLRQHYALGNQDRIVRLEFRLRYLELYATSASEVERQLTFEQIAALRFAPDDEFKELLPKAIANNLTGDAIKRSIRNWQPDHMRV